MCLHMDASLLVNIIYASGLPLVGSSEPLMRSQIDRRARDKCNEVVLPSITHLVPTLQDLGVLQGGIHPLPYICPFFSPFRICRHCVTEERREMMACDLSGMVDDMKIEDEVHEEEGLHSLNAIIGSSFYSFGNKIIIDKQYSSEPKDIFHTAILNNIPRKYFDRYMKQTFRNGNIKVRGRITSRLPIVKGGEYMNINLIYKRNSAFFDDIVWSGDINSGIMYSNNKVEYYRNMSIASGSIFPAYNPFDKVLYSKYIKITEDLHILDIDVNLNDDDVTMLKQSPSRKRKDMFDCIEQGYVVLLIDGPSINYEVRLVVRQTMIV